MTRRRALVTGIAGQDGSYLAELLLERGYDVHGLVRRNSVPEHESSRFDHLLDRVRWEYGDLLDQSSLERALRTARPHEIYNLAAQSHVRVSFDIPQFTAQANGLGVLNLLEACRRVAPDARIYQASSSEMFGNSIDADGYQRETTPMRPVSPYGCAKLFAYSIARNYRQAYGLRVSNGILFNHESPRRGSNFVTSKVVRAAVQIRAGKARQLVLGNLDSARDWGHAADYVRAMHLILGHDEPDDFVVATGVAHSVRDLCEVVFGRLGLDYREHVVQDDAFRRPDELHFLRGDAGRARAILGWEPTHTFATLIDDMLAHWQRVALRAAS
ncbi:MAG: GDP-mannose 4,6-dehydratase [Planctomycetota bacterium]